MTAIETLTAGPGDWRAAGAARWWHWLILAAVAGACVASRVIKHVVSGQGFFWDAQVYDGALKALGLGTDPYAKGAVHVAGLKPGYNFTYPPIMLDVLHPLRALDPRIVHFLYLTLFSLAFLATAYLFSIRIYGRMRGFERLCCLTAGIAAFTMAGTIAYSSGNFGVVLNGMIVATLVYAIRRGSWMPFCLAVIAAGCVKIFYLEFLAVMAVMTKFDRKSLAWCVGSLVATALVYFLYWQFDTVDTTKWLASLAHQSFTTGDVGDNAFALAARAGLGNLASLAVQAVFSLILLGLAMTKRLDRTPGARLSCAIVAAVFANPRLMMYDVYLAAFPAFYLLAIFIRQRLRLSPETAALAAVAILFAIGLLSLREHEVIIRPVVFPLTALLVMAIAAFGLTTAPDDERADASWRWQAAS